MPDAPFKDRMMAGLYDGCRKAAADNWSEMYFSRTTAGLNAMGPNAPRRGAAHRCAYWDARLGNLSLYARAKGTTGYACWAAGRDDRKDAIKRIAKHGLPAPKEIIRHRVLGTLEVI